MEQEEIRKELNELVATYYDGSFARLVQEYIRITGITEEEREALVEVVKNYQTSKKKDHEKTNLFYLHIRSNSI